MVDTLAAITKALLYGALLSCAGAVFASVTLRISDEMQATAFRIARLSSMLLLAACAAGVVVLIVRLGGDFDSSTLAAVFSSSTGAALFMQVTGALLLLSSIGDPTAKYSRAAFAALMTLSFAFSGHAAVAGPFEGLFGFAHATTAAWWIGSLWLLRRGCRDLNHIELAALVQRFSELATRVVGVLAVSGLLLIYVLVNFKSFPALSAYELNLARKLALVVAVLGLACYNKFRLTARVMAGDLAARRSLQRSIDAELLIIGAVLIATAVTTTFTSPHNE